MTSIFPDVCDALSTAGRSRSFLLARISRDGYRPAADVVPTGAPPTISKVLARLRLTEAQTLFRQNHFPGSYYLAVDFPTWELAVVSSTDGTDAYIYRGA